MAPDPGDGVEFLGYKCSCIASKVQWKVGGSVENLTGKPVRGTCLDF